MEKKSNWGKILAFIGVLVALGGIVVAVIHFWDDIKAKFSRNKCDVDDLEGFVDDEIDTLKGVAEDVQDDLEDFVEFEEL